ncbi:ABC transporter B family member 9 [Acorus gramineus]|uniref:ABC transporter B family member 9 n=1 Tax=Acorus gramineus TaxID=55184 RepID=A0AAV9BIL1_ACOGR|nr:ABC transporter B family member 9 [Acorus gramineus]
MKQEEAERDESPPPPKAEAEEVERVAFHKLFTFADTLDVFLMVVGTVAGIGNGLAMPIMTLVFGELIDAFGSSDSRNIVHAVSKGLEALSLHSNANRQAARIRGLYLKTILRQDIAFFDKETTTGEVIGRMSGDTILIQDAMGEKVGKFIQLISTFIGGFVVAFIKGWLLSLVMLSCIPPLVISAAVMSIILARMSSRGQKAYALAGNVVEQTIGSIRTVVAFSGEAQAIKKYDELLKTAYSASVFEGLAGGLGIGVVMLVLFSSYGLAIWYGSRLIIEKGYNGGLVINVILAIMTGGMSLGQASPSLNAFAAGQAAAYKMFETIERKPEIDAGDTNGIVLEGIKGDIELRDVSFSYPARPDVQIFDGFSFKVPSGTTAALVGESGSGKSTVISLVERFYDPHAGQVLIDGINLKKFQLKWIREKIGLVSQEPILFTTTIKENIAYGKEGATLEEIRRATELANAAKFIDKMPNGLDTLVGEHGTQLSGGQKQRIAIARAILKNPKILLLDEATSALDAESERIVQDALMRIMLDRTTIVVAHRLSTIRNADMIAVVHRGKIVEQGSHSELFKDPDGAYAQLIKLQEVKNQSEEATVDDSERPATSFDAGKSASRSGSHRYSLRRSISRNSSGGSSRHSFSISFGVPGAVSFHEEGVPAVDESNTYGNKDSESQPVPLRRLAYLNKPEIPVLLLGSAAAAIHGVLLPIFGLLLSTAIKIFYEPEHKLRKDSRFWALMFTFLGVVALAIIPMQNYFFGIAGGKLIQRIRSMSFMQVLHQEISFFDDPSNSSGSIGARLSADASTVRRLVGDALGLLVQNFSTVVTGLVIAMIANWRLALIILVLLPLVGLQGFVQMQFLKGFSADAKVMYEEASQVANDAVSSIRTVASFCAEQRVMDLYRKKCESPMKHGVRTGIVSGIGYGVSFFFLFSMYALSFYVGARFVASGKATFQEVFKVFFALTLAALGVSQSSALAPDTNKAKDSTASIFAILDRKSKIDSSDETGTTLANVKGNIDFHHVSFKYPTRPDVQIFRDLCLSVPSGKTVALVGESGSGKSTVISLLERFYDPDSGQILLDKVEIQSFKLSWLREQMGLVSQEPVLFNETIRTNIAYGKRGDVSEEEIIEAAKKANAHSFISSLPQGYNTSVGERGVQLSGGQKQRIAIARSMVKDPRILLLDEATSALDAESERVVQEALDRVMVERTTIVVAHRLSTIKGADVIAVVKNGVIAEQGRHEVLMKIQGGAYASLVALHMSAPV